MKIASVPLRPVIAAKNAKIVKIQALLGPVGDARVRATLAASPKSRTCAPCTLNLLKLTPMPLPLTGLRYNIGTATVV